MIDWDRNGKIDPTDVGISLMVFDEEDVEEEIENKSSKQKGSCLSYILLIFALITLLIITS